MLPLNEFTKLDQSHHALLQNLTETKSELVRQSNVVVIIPFYNGSKFIERSVRSIFEQTIPATEVIVVNDGSEDSESNFLADLVKKYTFTVINKANGGQGSARNAGVAASKSKYICFLDQDDFYLPNHIETLLNAIPKNDTRLGFVYADLYEADEDGNIVRMSMVKDHSDHPKRDIVKLLGRDMFVLPSASIISRKSFQEVGGFDPQLMGYEDDDLFLRIFRAGYSNYFVDEPVTVWCIHLGSTSYSVRMSRSRWKYFCKLTDLYPDEAAKVRFFFRDLLLPRFGPLFIKDAIKAKLLSKPDLPELLEILRSFSNMVQENASVPTAYKLKLRIAIYLLESFPASFVKALLKRSRYGATLAL